MSEQPGLVSFRGLVEGFRQTPLQEFKGIFESFSSELNTNFTPPGTNVHLNFKDLEVIRSTEPYNFPIAQITLPLNKSKSSQWGILGISAAKFMAEDEDIGSLQGKRVHMTQISHDMWNRREGKEVPRDCWEIIGVEGIESASGAAKGSASQRALELLDGKTEAAWNQAAFQDPVIKADGGLITNLLSKAFIPTMIAAGKITKDENEVYHLVKES